MNKALQLIFEYNTAPDSLKKVAKSYKDSANKLTKAEADFKAAESNLNILRRQTTELEKAFSAEISAWTPKGE